VRARRTAARAQSTGAASRLPRASGRNRIPPIEAPVALAEWLDARRGDRASCAPGVTALASLAAVTALDVRVGSEGGFDAAESPRRNARDRPRLARAARAEGGDGGGRGSLQAAWRPARRARRRSG
jgi:hypothetical protein